MSEKKAQSRKEFGKTCKMPENAPDYLKQKGQHANPELVKMIQMNHQKTQRAVQSRNGGQILLKDNGC